MITDTEFESALEAAWQALSDAEQQDYLTALFADEPREEETP